MANLEPLIQSIKNTGLVNQTKNLIEQAKRGGLSEEATKIILQQARDQHRTLWMEPVEIVKKKGAKPTYISYNLAPDAQFKVVRFPSGEVKKIPWDDPIPQNATVLNKTVEDLDKIGFAGKDPVKQAPVDPNVQAAVNAATAREAPVGKIMAGGALAAGVPAFMAAEYASYADTRKKAQEEAARQEAARHENDNYPAYNGRSPVETAIMALGAQRPSEGLTENENYIAGNGMSPVYQGISFESDPMSGRNINSANISNAPTGFNNATQPQATTGQPNTIGMDMRGSANFNPSAMRFSTDRPVVKAAQQAAQQATQKAATATQPQSGGLSALLSSIFSNKGGEYQSTGDRLYRGDMPEKGMNVQKPTGVNWGDPDRASDFFRASKAYQGLQGDQPAAEKRGGRVSKSNEHSAILHKALEIIHHMALKNH